MTPEDIATYINEAEEYPLELRIAAKLWMHGTTATSFQNRVIDNEHRETAFFQDRMRTTRRRLLKIKRCLEAIDRKGSLDLRLQMLADQLVIRLGEPAKPRTLAG